MDEYLHGKTIDEEFFVLKMKDGDRRRIENAFLRFLLKKDRDRECLSRIPFHLSFRLQY